MLCRLSCKNELKGSGQLLVHRAMQKMVKHGWELESKCHEMKVERKIQSKLKVDLDEMYFIGRMKNKISGSA